MSAGCSCSHRSPRVLPHCDTASKTCSARARVAQAGSVKRARAVVGQWVLHSGQSGHARCAAMPTDLGSHKRGLRGLVLQQHCRSFASGERSQRHGRGSTRRRDRLFRARRSPASRLPRPAAPLLLPPRSCCATTAPARALLPWMPGIVAARAGRWEPRARNARRAAGGGRRAPAWAERGPLLPRGWRLRGLPSRCCCAAGAAAAARALRAERGEGAPGCGGAGARLREPGELPDRVVGGDSARQAGGVANEGQGVLAPILYYLWPADGSRALTRVYQATSLDCRRLPCHPLLCLLLCV